MKKFFVVCPLGFEWSLQKEIQESWPLLVGKDGRPHGLPVPALKVEKGGIELSCEEILGYQLNFFLKTASRVLLRLAEFKVRDFPKLHEKIRALPWQEYFSTTNVQYEVAAAKSRLNHEGRIEETFVKTLQGILPAGKGEPEGNIYVRIFDDLCTVSLDTTGEHLHKRGWATLKGDAPMRETIAAFILRTLIQDHSREDLAQVTICDPMMGSGSFLLEARSLAFPNTTREFAFRRFKSCPKILLSASFAFNYKLPASSLFKAYWGSDVDSRMLEIAEKNWQTLESEMAKVERKNFAPASHQLSCQDLFVDFNRVPEHTWLVANPPYGERLQEASVGDLNDFVAAFAASGAEKIAVLYLASKPLAPSQVPGSYEITSEIPVLNGGLKTLLTILKKRPL